MTILELISTLQRRYEAHGDVEVMVTWEGTVHGIDPAHVYKGWKGLSYDCLLIDADGNMYKGDLAQDPTEGENE